MARFLIFVVIGAMWPIALYQLRILSIRNIKIFLFFSSIGAFSALLGPGKLPATGSVIWLIASLVVALKSAFIWLKAKDINILSITKHSIPAFTAFGSIWLIASNMEYRLLGFSHEIVLLTVAHFHATGGCFLALCYLNAQKSQSPIGKFTCFAGLVGIPLTAIGISIGGAAEGVGALMTIFASVLLCIHQIQFKKIGCSSNVEKMLRFVSSLSLLIAMAFAFAYALNHFGFNIDLTIQTMVKWHASLNVFGFIGLGLIASWRSERELPLL